MKKFKQALNLVRSNINISCFQLLQVTILANTGYGQV